MGNHDYEEQGLAHGQIVPLNSEYGNTGFKFTVDKSHSGKEDERIRQLEKQCAGLAAEMDRMRPVVDAAVLAVSKTGLLPMMLIEAVTTYQASNPK